MGVWGRVFGQYEKNFDRNLQGNYSAFQKGLIWDSIIYSYLRIIGNMNGGSLKFWKSLSFR